MESKYHSFEDLWIWQEAMQVCYEVYDHMKDCRNFKLRDQMLACSVSVPSNIAEGFELHTDRLFIKHLYISKGSNGELRTQLYVAIRQKHISDEVGCKLVAKVKRLSAAIQNFINIRKKSKRRLPT